MISRTIKQSKLAPMYAHRGFHIDAPENSIEAFRAAINRGLAVELDVHMAADGTLVVFHDDDLTRVTGAEGIIDEWTTEELKQLTLDGTDQQIPTFDEVLELFERERREDGTIAPLLIELKVVKGNYKKLARAVCARLESYEGEYAIQSFDPRAIIEVRRIDPDIPRGQLSKNYFLKKENVAAFMLPVLTDMRLNFLAKPDFISYKFKDRSNKALRRAVDQKGVKEACWTIRTPEAFRKALAAGCIPIFEGFDPDEIDDNPQRTMEV